MQTKKEKINNGWLKHNSVKKHLFQVFMSVSGCSSAEKDWTDNSANWKTLRILLIVKKESLLDGLLYCKFCYERAFRCVAFAYLPYRADSYTKLQYLHSNDIEQFKKFNIEKTLAINIIVIETANKVGE